MTATEFDNDAHYGLFLTGQSFTPTTGKYVRQSELTLAALRAAGVFDQLEDGTTPPVDTTKLWLDKNSDPAVLKYWNSAGSAWSAATFDALFGRLPWQGAWDSGTTYKKNDVVKYNDITYIALRATANDQPDSSPLDWDVFVSPGLPATASTYLKRNSGNSEFEALTPTEVADDLRPYFSVATIAALTAKTKASLSDGATILVHAEGTGGVFKWVAASTEYADGGIVLASDEGGTGRWIRQFEGAEVYFVWWGGVVNSEASAAANSTALDAFIEFFRNSSLYFTARLVFGAGRWYFSGEHDFGSVGTSRILVMQGMGDGVTYLATTLAGADKVFIRNGPTGTERDNRVSFRGITFEARNAAGTVCPIIIWCDDWQESVMDDCRIVAPALTGQLPGTHAVFRAVWNCTLQDSHFLGGGDYRPQNPLTDTVRFTLTSGSAVVTASEAVFSAGDVGRDFMFGDPSGIWWGTVSTFDSTTQVTLTENAPLSMSSVRGWSEPVTASTTATDSTVTLSHDSAVASDVGRWVVIRSAGTVNSRQSAHYAQITAVNSATSIEVSPAPPRTVSGVTMYWSPQVVIYENDSALPVRTNDFTITNTRFYFYRGLAMAIMNAVQMKFDEAKFHGAATGYDETARGMSQAALLIQSTGGTFTGVLEAAGWDDGRIICTGSDHFVVEHMQGRCAKGKAILYSEHPVSQYSTFTLGECQIFNQQYDLTSAGQRTAGYISGPSGVRQTFNMVGPVSVGSGTGKRLVGGGPGMIVTGISVRGSEFTFIADNASDNFELPGSYRNGSQKAGIINVFTLSGKGALFSYQTNGSSSYNCELIAGDTGFWAASNTPDGTTASRVTVSVGNSVFYINNDVGTAHSFNWLPIG